MAPGQQVVSQNAWKACTNNTHPIWYKDAGLRKSIGAIFMYMTAQALGGYDKSLINNLQAIPTWGEALGNPSGGRLGILTAMLSIGVIAGSPIFGYLSDRIGRRYTMWAGAVFMLIGAVLQAAANGYELFMGGRFIIGFGAAGTLCSGPLLTSEIAHPRQRGVVTAFYNTMWYVGSIICAWLSFGTSFWTGSDWAWRIPCIGQAVPPIIIICATYWLPESPRYLIKKGRDEEAKRILAYYHANGDMDDQLVNFEIAEIKQALEIEERYESRGIFKPWLDLVSTKANRHRLFIINWIVLSIDWCGTSITSYYLSSILRSVGITSANQQTGINGGLQIFNWLTAVLGASLVDKVGRRPLWLFTLGGMLAVNIPFGACSALYATRGNVAAGRAVIALVFLYQGAYNIGCNPLPYLYTVEILPYSIRAKGLSFEVGWDGVHGVLGQYTNPMALEALEWRFYFVYTGLLVLFITGVWFTFPETKGYTLEDIAAIFGDATTDPAEIGQRVEQVQDRDLLAKEDGDEPRDGRQSLV